MPPSIPSLSISLVTYHGDDRAALRSTLEALAGAVQRAVSASEVASAVLHVVDNGSDAEALDSLVRRAVRDSPLSVLTHRGHGNVGFGRGHNIAIRQADTDYHLVLNPDVIMADDALRNAAAFLSAHQDVGLVTPLVTDEQSERQYLCRDYPSVFVLFLRSAAPKSLRARFKPMMDRHELRDRIGDHPDLDIPLATGCFMFTRTKLLREIAGFSPQYFLYFEDHDLSLRLRRRARIGYVPAVQIVHFGGNTSRKGARHVRMYVRSAFTFFQTHGWRLV